MAGPDPIGARAAYCNRIPSLFWPSFFRKVAPDASGTGRRAGLPALTHTVLAMTYSTLAAAYSVPGCLKSLPALTHTVLAMAYSTLAAAYSVLA